MDARPPLRQKPDTTEGFRPSFRRDPRHVERAQAIARLDGVLDLFNVRPVWANDLRRRTAISNAHSSSSIEGNPLSEREAFAVVEAYDRTGTPSQDADGREIVQHVRYFERLQAAHPDATPDLTLDEIEATHAELLEGVIHEDRGPGTLRGPQHQRPVQFGGNEGTPWERVQAELDALLAWYNGPGLRHPLPVRVAIWLHEFLSIHPFLDGNGRTGRALTHRLLITQGLPNAALIVLDAQFNEDRTGYTDALDAARVQDDLTPWIEYFLDRLLAAYERARAMSRQLSRLPPDLPPAQTAVLSAMVSLGPAEASTGSLAKKTGYAAITVSQALSALASQGHVAHNGLKGPASRYRITLHE